MSPTGTRSILFVTPLLYTPHTRRTEAPQFGSPSKSSFRSPRKVTQQLDIAHCHSNSYTWAQAYAIQYMLFEEATSAHDTPYTRTLVEIVKNTTGMVHTLLAGDVCIFSASRRWNDLSGTHSHKLHTNGICLAHTPLARPGYTTSGNRSKHHYADIFLTFPVPPPGSHTLQGSSYGESHCPSENLVDTATSFSNMRVLSHRDAQQQVEQHSRRLTEGINFANPDHRRVEFIFQVRACHER